MIYEIIEKSRPRQTGKQIPELANERQEKI